MPYLLCGSCLDDDTIDQIVPVLNPLGTGTGLRWGPQALEHLVEIYISPNGDHLWEVTTAAPAGGDGSAESLGAARYFLSELEKMTGGDVGGGGAGGGAISNATMRRRYEHTKTKHGVPTAISFVHVSLIMSSTARSVKRCPSP